MPSTSVPSLAALVLVAGSCRPSALHPERSTTTASRVDAARVVRVAAPVVRRFDALPDPRRDGQPLTVCGALEPVTIGPVGGPPNMVLWRVALAGQGGAGVLLGPIDPWPRASEGAPAPGVAWSDASTTRVCATGTWQHEYPLAPGDPPHASRFSGQWLFGVTVVAD